MSSYDLWSSYRKVEWLLPKVAWANAICILVTVGVAITKHLPLAPLILITLLLTVATATVGLMKWDLYDRATRSEFYEEWLRAWKANLPDDSDTYEMKQKKLAAQRMLPVIARIRNMHRIF